MDILLLKSTIQRWNGISNHIMFESKSYQGIATEISWVDNEKFKFAWTSNRQWYFNYHWYGIWSKNEELQNSYWNISCNNFGVLRVWLQKGFTEYHFFYKLSLLVTRKFSDFRQVNICISLCTVLVLAWALDSVFNVPNGHLLGAWVRLWKFSFNKISGQ